MPKKQTIKINNELPYVIHATWGGLPQDQWYKPLNIEIVNRTNQDVVNPKISFDVSRLNYNGEIRAYTGFAQTMFGPEVVGTLSGDSFATLKANSSTTLTFGVNFASAQTTTPPLPVGFVFNDVPVVIPEDHEAPTTPGMPLTVAIGPHNMSLNWTSSEDNVAVKNYIVSVNSSGKNEESFITNSPNINLKNLTTNTSYSVKIQAEDYSGNKSEVTIPKEFTTSSPLPGPGEWQIAGSEFVDYTAWPTPDINKYAETTNLKGYFLGFVTGAKDNGVLKACWGGNLSMYDGSNDQTYNGDVTVSGYKKADIQKFRDNGGEVILSFGGASNEPIESGLILSKNIKMLANTYAKNASQQSLSKLEKDLESYFKNYNKPFNETLEDVNKIVVNHNGKQSLELLASTGDTAQIYLKTIENYNLKYIDFDFEGGFLGNVPALEKHIAAITEVIKQKPDLKISYTLPVDGAPGLMGLNANGEALLKMLHDAGIKPSLINAMSMEFGQGSSNDLFECVRLSIEGQEIPGDQNAAAHRGLHKQIKEIYGDIWNDAEIYAHIGICPMFGKHLNGKIFTLENQTKLNDYALDKGIANLNGWDATRDMIPAKLEMGSNTPAAGSFGEIIAAFTDEVDVTGDCA